MPASLKHKPCESHKPYTHKAEPQPRDQNAQKTSALKQIHGSQLTLEDLLNPIEEDEVGTMGYEFPHGNNDIIAQVLQEQGRDEVDEDEDEDSNGDEKPKEVMWLKDTLDLCICMEQLCLEYANLDISVLNLQTQICKFRGHFQWLVNISHKQSSLDQYWSKPDITTGV